jgi:hypothetical protein
VLRKDFDALRPAHVPDGPTHAARLAATRAAAGPGVSAEATDGDDAGPAVDRWTGTRAEDENVPALR